MAIAQAAVAAGSAVVKYAPQVYNRGMELVSKATSGRVKTVGDITNFVKDDPRKLSVVAGALASAGVSPDDLIPRDLAALNPQLMQVRATIERVAGGMRDQYDRGSDQSVAATDSDTAKDVLRKQRVEAVLAVYGTPEKYFLCHPNGGVPRADFSWYKSMGFRR